MQRSLAISIGALSLPLGCLIGLGTGPFFISENDEIDNKLV